MRIPAAYFGLLHTVRQIVSQAKCFLVVCLRFVPLPSRSRSDTRRLLDESQFEARIW